MVNFEAFPWFFSSSTNLEIVRCEDVSYRYAKRPQFLFVFFNHSSGRHFRECLLGTGVRFSAKYCVICIFRPVVVTGACTCHLTISQILNKSTKISKNQNKPTQLPVTTTCRKMQYCWNSNTETKSSNLIFHIVLRY